MFNYHYPREQALIILKAALQAVEPQAAVHNVLNFNPITNILQVAQTFYDLSQIKRIILVGAGKATAPMAQAVCAVLGQRITTGAIVVKYGHLPTQPLPIEVYQAGHPVLDHAGIIATQRVVDLISNLTEHDLLICLISGGASALLEMPVEGVSLVDLQTLNTLLLKSGLPITAFNVIRKHLSKVKGGQLAALASPARLIGLFLSDVVGDDLAVIGSGPTVPDPSTFQDALNLLQTLPASQIPPSILAYLRQTITETPKPNNPIFERVQNVIIGSNRIAALAALQKARELGFNSLLLTSLLEGDSHYTAHLLVKIAQEIQASGNPLSTPACVIIGGETTLQVRGTGKGGRNQELALVASLALENRAGIMLVSFATDGNDGPTEAAGAFADANILELARQRNLDPHDYLARNDAYHFFEQVDGLLKTGPTNTNVSDLILVFVW